jgi:hypothetical protein
MDGVPFPDKGRPPGGVHVGGIDCVCFTTKMNLPNESEWTWALFQTQKRDDAQTQERLVCSYTNTVQAGMVKAYISRRYTQWIRQGTACIRTVKNKAT